MVYYSFFQSDSSCTPSPSLALSMERTSNSEFTRMNDPGVWAKNPDILPLPIGTWSKSYQLPFDIEIYVYFKIYPITLIKWPGAILHYYTSSSYHLALILAWTFDSPSSFYFTLYTLFVPVPQPFAVLLSSDCFILHCCIHNTSLAIHESFL